MSQMYIKGQLVSGPDQFNQLVSEVLKAGPGRSVTRFLASERVAKRLSSYAGMWQEEQPLLGLDQLVSVRQLLYDICGILQLTEEERNYILATQLPLPGGE